MQSRCIQVVTDIRDDEIVFPIGIPVIMIEFMGHISIKINKETNLPYDPMRFNSIYFTFKDIEVQL